MKEEPQMPGLQSILPLTSEQSLNVHLTIMLLNKGLLQLILASYRELCSAV